MSEALKELRDVCIRMWSKIEAINDRTKKHTIYIRELQKEVKKWKKQK